jgi:hypothetical protein
MEDLKNEDMIEEVVASEAEEIDSQVEEVIDELQEDQETVVEAKASKKEDAHEDEEEEDEAEESVKKESKSSKKEMVDDEEDEDEDEEVAESKSSKKEDMNGDEEEDDEEEVKESPKKKMNASYKVAKEDIDVKEDVDAMLAGQELTEEFQSQVKTIFEAAVVAKVNEQLEKMYEDYETELHEEVSHIREDISEKVNEYLTYVAKEWVEENKLAVENALKLEVMENFMSGLKTLFEENYVDVPEDKIDLYGDALSSLEEKETKLDESVQKNIELTKKIEALETEIILKDVTEGLTVSQVEKVRTLSESVDFVNADDMRNKITLIRDNYFPSETSVESESILAESALETSVEDSPVVKEENKFQSVMDIYARALNKPKD